MFHLIHLETLFESSQVASRYNAAEQEVEDLQVGSKPTKSLEEKSYEQWTTTWFFRVYMGWTTTRLWGDSKKPFFWGFLLNKQYVSMFMESETVCFVFFCFFSWPIYTWIHQKTKTVSWGTGHRRMRLLVVWLQILASYQRSEETSQCHRFFFSLD